MKFLSKALDTLRLELSRRELRLLRNVLNELANGLRIEDRDLQTRLGCSRADLRNLLQELGDMHRQVWGNESDQSSDERTSMTAIDLRTTQFLTLKAALLDLVSHDDIEDWEFHRRLGVQPQEARELLDQMTAIAGTLQEYSSESL